MVLSIRFSEEEAKLIKQHALLKQVSVSQLIRESILCDLEDEYDLAAYYDALKESGSYSHEEVKGMLDLS